MRPIDALDVLCAQLTRDLFAIAKFLLLVAKVKGLQTDITGYKDIIVWSTF